jgi:DNA-binding MarR family transcriptional regulator
MEMLMEKDELVEKIIKNMNALMSRKGHRHEYKMDFFSKGELFTLMVISHGEINKAKELAKYMNCSQARIAKIFDSLSKKGLISVETDENDRRSSIIKITESGKDFVLEEQNKANTKVGNVIDALGIEDSIELNRIIEKLIIIMNQTKGDTNAKTI